MARGWSRAAAVLAVGFALSAPAVHAVKSSKAPRRVHVEVVLDIAPDGEVQSIRIQNDRLHPTLAARVADVARGWRFEPIVREGKAVGGSTTADVQVCVLPADERLQIAVIYLGHGPGAQWAAPPSLLNGSKVLALERQGAHSAVVSYRYRVQADGSGTLESARLVDPDLERHFNGPVLTKQMAKWVDASRFHPETIDGAAVSTLMEGRLELAWARDPEDVERANRASAQKACDIDENQRSVAVDSPFHLEGGG